MWENMNSDGYGSDSCAYGSSPLSLKSLSISCVGRRIRKSPSVDVHSSLLGTGLPDRVKDTFWDDYDRTEDPIRWWFSRRPPTRDGTTAASNLFYWGPAGTGKRLDVDSVLRDVYGDERRRRTVCYMKGFFAPRRIERRHTLVVLDDVQFRMWHVDDFVALAEKRFLLRSEGGDWTADGPLLLVEADTVFLSEIPPEEFFSRPTSSSSSSYSSTTGMPSLQRWISENLFVVRKRNLPPVVKIDEGTCRTECACCDERLVPDESGSVLRCGHVFHPTCILNRLEIDDGTCPRCVRYFDWSRSTKEKQNLD